MCSGPNHRETGFSKDHTFPNSVTSWVLPHRSMPFPREDPTTRLVGSVCVGGKMRALPNEPSSYVAPCDRTPVSCCYSIYRRTDSLDVGSGSRQASALGHLLDSHMGAEATAQSEQNRPSPCAYRAFTLRTSRRGTEEGMSHTVGFHCGLLS